MVNQLLMLFKISSPEGELEIQSPITDTDEKFYIKFPH